MSARQLRAQTLGDRLNSVSALNKLVRLSLLSPSYLRRLSGDFPALFRGQLTLSRLTP